MRNYYFIEQQDVPTPGWIINKWINKSVYTTLAFTTREDVAISIRNALEYYKKNVNK